MSLITGRDEWYDCGDDIHTFAGWLEEQGILETASNAIDYFEKPWKWEKEHRDYLAMEREGATCDYEDWLDRQDVEETVK